MENFRVYHCMELYKNVHHYFYDDEISDFIYRRHVQCKRLPITRFLGDPKIYLHMHCTFLSSYETLEQRSVSTGLRRVCIFWKERSVTRMAINFIEPNRKKALHAGIQNISSSLIAKFISFSIRVH